MSNTKWDPHLRGKRDKGERQASARIIAQFIKTSDHDDIKLTRQEYLKARDDLKKLYRECQIDHDEETDRMSHDLDQQQKDLNYACQRFAEYINSHAILSNHQGIVQLISDCRTDTTALNVEDDEAADAPDVSWAQRHLNMLFDSLNQALKLITA